MCQILVVQLFVFTLRAPWRLKILAFKPTGALCSLTWWAGTQSGSRTRQDREDCS